MAARTPPFSSEPSSLRLALRIGVVAGLAAGAADFAGLGLAAYRAAGPLGAARVVVVPHGGMQRVAAALQSDGVVSNAFALRAAALLTTRNGPVRAAELAFPAHASLSQVLAVLRTGRPVQHLLTIPEGLTAAQIAELVSNADALDGPAPLPPEGAVLPQTYAYERNASRTGVLARGEAAMQRSLQDGWESRDPALPLSTPEQALILASIVERETARPEERAHIAAIFLNRLRLGMKLQSDPTVLYGASGGLGSLDRPLTRADLEHDDPYNTYRIDGLPPGPICSPGLAALTAVLHPAASPDLYFVADGTGGHAFSASLRDHERNVKVYRAFEHRAEASSKG